MNVLIDENNPYLNEVLSNYTFINNIILFKGRNLNNEILLESDCEVLFCRSTSKVNDNLLKNSKVKFLATVTSGIDHIDLEAIKKYGIHFANALGSNSNGVTEFVLYSILDWLSKNNKIADDYSKYKLGIIGFGNIGQKVAFYANKLGFEIFVNDTPLKNKNYEFPSYTHYKELDEMLNSCDIITNHIPLENTLNLEQNDDLCNNSNNNTYKLLNDNLIHLKPNSCFIHSSRGSIVDEEKLSHLSPKSNISLYIDVWENEPAIDTKLKLMAEISTPHIAGHTYNSKIKGVKMVLESFDKYCFETLGEKINSSIILDEILANDFELNKNMDNLINFSSTPANKFLEGEFKTRLYNKLKVNRKFDELSKSIKNDYLLNDINNTAFDNYRKDYNSFETIAN